MRTLLQKLNKKLKDKYIMPTSLKKEIVNKNLHRMKILLPMLFCYGLFFRTTCILPFDKVIYMKIYKTPLDRAFNLSFAILKTVKGFLVLPEIADNNILLLKKFVNGDICE